MSQAPRVLLVDDSTPDLVLHQIAFEEAGYPVELESYQKAAEALRDIEAGTLKPDLILLDINMPGMDGWEFAEAYDQLQESQRTGTIVMMLTTSLNPSDRERAERCGVIERFFNKPLTAEMIETMLRTHGFLDD